jgi:hypothetical protein
MARAKPALGQRLLHRSGGAIFGMLIVLAQLGSGTPLQRSLDQLQQSVTRPVPQAPPSPAASPRDVWVPDRIVSDPISGQWIQVPGHWQHRLPSGELYGPPTTICDPRGNCATIPAGTRPAPDPRQSP